MKEVRVLLIEDNPGDARLIKEMLSEVRDTPFVLEWKDTLQAGLARLAEGNVHVVLLDLGLPDSPQRSYTFERTRTVAATVPVVVLTGLDDDTFAITTVRRGAQDYLVKGKIDTGVLVRAIRYAIARKAGGERRLTPADLARFDGREGRPAYIAFKGRVLDVSGSYLWTEGDHNGHLAGRDLTESLLNAPHGEETLLRMPVIGEMAREETFQRRLVLRIERLRPHPMMLHFSIVYAFSSTLFAVVAVAAAQPVFETISYFMLLLGVVAGPFCGISGVFSWKVAYEGKMTRVFAWKIGLTAGLFAVTVGAFVWRSVSPLVVLSAPWSYAYLGLLASQVPLVVLLGHYGGRIVYP